MKKLILLSFAVLIAVTGVFAQTVECAPEDAQIQCKISCFPYLHGTQLHFVTVTNNSSKSILLRNESSLKGHVFSKERIEANNVHLPIASKNGTKNHYLIKYNLFEQVAPASFSGLFAWLILYAAALGGQEKGEINKDRNVGLYTFLITSIAPLSYIYFNLGSIITNNNMILKQFSECEYWLEAPTKTIEPYQSVTFSLLISGRYEIMIFDNKAPNEQVTSFTCELM